MNPNITPFIADGETDKDFPNISLVKLVGGKSIKDIRGHINEYGCFQMYEIVLEDDTYFWAEGSHDNPYLVKGNADYSVDLETLGYDEDDEGGD